MVNTGFNDVSGLAKTMEILLPLGHALMERPPMGGKRIGVVTMGGSLERYTGNFSSVTVPLASLAMAARASGALPRPR